VTTHVVDDEAGGTSRAAAERGEAYAPQHSTVTEAPAEGDTLIIKEEHEDLGTLKVRTGLTLAGEVVAENGTPIARQWVEARRIRDPNQRQRVLSSVVTTVDRYAMTDEQGKVTFAPLPPGDYLVAPCEHDGTLPAVNRNQSTPIQGVFYSLKTTLRDGAEPKPFLLKAVPAVKIVAQYYSSDGKKTSGDEAYVSGRHIGGDDYWQTNARGQEGQVELLAPRGLGDARLMVFYDPGSLRFRKSAHAPLQAGQDMKLGTLETDLTDIQVICYVAPILLVKPIDGDGKPLDAAEVSGQYNDRSIDEPVGFKQQKDGWHQSSHLLPDEKCTITVTAPGRRPESRTVSLAEGATYELTLKLETR
jgi:hypothetical protein